MRIELTSIVVDDPGSGVRFYTEVLRFNGNLIQLYEPVSARV
jgi:hypothetical protein